MKEFFRRPLVIGIIIYFIVQTSIIYLFDLSPVCRDGWPSPSIGRSGACSHHGGVVGIPGAIFIILFSQAAALFGTHHLVEWLERAKKRKIIAIDHDAPDCPTHGKMQARLDNNGMRTYACNQHSQCQDNTDKNAPACPHHGKMGLIINDSNGRRSWACRHYPNCPYYRPYTPNYNNSYHLN